MSEAIQTEITEAQLSRRLALYIRNLPVANVRTIIQAGLIAVTGRISMAFLSMDFRITGHAVVENGHVLMVADRVEPWQIVSLSPIQRGQKIDLGLNLDATGVQLVPGRMVVTSRGQ